MESKHIPVLIDEVLGFVSLADRGQKPLLVLDCTLGAGGYTRGILEKFPGSLMIALDRDRIAIDYCEESLRPYSERLVICQSNFAQAKDVVDKATMENRLWADLANHRGVPLFDGIVADLGLSSIQLDNPERGFSFTGDGPLDMRMDRDQELTASALLNESNVYELADILRKGGQSKDAMPLARRIVNERPVSSTSQLSQLCSSFFSGARRRLADRAGDPGRKKNPATVVFQALRIAVNKELESLNDFIQLIPSLLAPGGVLCVVSFHSLEDKSVARGMRSWSRSESQYLQIPVVGREQSWGDILTPKAIVPSEEEIARNPRSRSARLRAFKRSLGAQGMR